MHLSHGGLIVPAINYYPALTKICGGIDANIMFSHLVDLKHGNRNSIFCRTYEDLQSETAFTEKEVVASLRKLKHRNFISLIKNDDGGWWFGVNEDVFSLAMEASNV